MTPPRGMSGAGLLVVGTLCLSLLLALGTVCYLAATGGEVPPQLETIVGGLLVGVPALLARTYADRRETGDDDPVTVQAPPGEPLEVTAAQRGADPGWRAPTLPDPPDPGRRAG